MTVKTRLEIRLLSGSIGAEFVGLNLFENQPSEFITELNDL
jgi:hypothetical protein